MEKLIYLVLVLLVIGSVWLHAWYFAAFRRKIGTLPFILLTLVVYTAVFFASYYFTLTWG